MYNITIKKDEQDGIILVVNDGTDEETFDLRFDGLKKYGEFVLKDIINFDSFDYEIHVENAKLDLYKNTVETITNSIIEDTELHKLYEKHMESKE